MSIGQLSDLGSILTHKIEWMITGAGISAIGIAVPTVAPTLVQKEIVEIANKSITMADVSLITGWFFGVVVGFLSIVKIYYAIKEHKLSIKLKEKELLDD